MSKLIIIRGNSGSGKSTLAGRLQRKFGRNTMVISQDTARREMLWAKDGEGTPALPLMEELLRYGRRHSEVVILEGIMKGCLKRLRRSLEKISLRITMIYPLRKLSGGIIPDRRLIPSALRI